MAKIHRCFIGISFWLVLIGFARTNSLYAETLLGQKSFEGPSTIVLSGFTFTNVIFDRSNQLQTLTKDNAALISTQGLASLLVASSGGKITLNGNDAYIRIPIDFPVFSSQNNASPQGSSSNWFYISFLFRSVLETRSSGYSGLCLGDKDFNGGTVLIGNSWSSQTTSIVDNLAHTSVDLRNFCGSGEFNIADTYTHLVVLKISRILGKTNIFTVWLDPDPITGESAQTSPTTYVGMLDSNHTFDKILLHGGTNNPMDFDEIRMGTTWAAVLPPPHNSRSEFPKHDFDSWPAYFAAHLESIQGYSFMARYNGKVAAFADKGDAQLPSKNDGKAILWTTQERIHIASISKTITATAVIKLLEEKSGQFSLDSSFWPFLQNTFPKASDASKKITIRQLLTHRSGLTEDAADVRSVASILASVKNNSPGVSSSYNNLNYYLLRLFIEKVSGQPYSQYVKNHVLVPAGASAMDLKSEEKPEWNTTAFAGAIGWHASTSDLTSFLYAVSHGRVISKPGAEIMFHEALGWDPIIIGGQTIGYRKSGNWLAKDGHGQTAEAAHFVDGVDVALLINSHISSQNQLLVMAWQLEKSSQLSKLTHSAGF